MAKGYYSCAKCGATCTCWAASGKQADSRAQWLEKQGALCDKCEAADRELQARAAAEKNAANGLPSLHGTEKQIAWAEALRAETVAQLDQVAALLQGESLPEDMNPAKALVVRQAAASAVRKRVDAGTWLVFCELVASQDRASWWIDTRQMAPDQLLEALRGELRARLMPVQSPEPPAGGAAQPPGESPESAAAEALLLPKARNDCPHIAEIGIAGKTITASLPVPNDQFRELMRATGMKWARPRWERTLSTVSGSPEDRAAELGHALLAAGFMVTIHDEQARERARAGTFEPEHWSWFSAVTRGPMKGWFAASWSRADDYFEPIRAISGSRLHQGKLYLPASSADEVSEFAEQYGFRLTPGAEQLVADYHAAIAAGAVIEARKGKAPVIVRLGDAPAPLEIPQTAEVDDDLCDHD